MIKDNKGYDIEFAREEEIETTSTSLELITISIQIKGHIQARNNYEDRNQERKVFIRGILGSKMGLLRKIIK